MNNNSNTKIEADQLRNSGDNRNSKEPSDFIVGLLTFIAFILFMTTWMYFAV
jgi:hypothetical protein